MRKDAVVTHTLSRSSQSLGKHTPFETADQNFLLRNQLADVTPSVRVDGTCGVDVGAM